MTEIQGTVLEEADDTDIQYTLIDNSQFKKSFRKKYEKRKIMHLLQDNVIEGSPNNLSDDCLIVRRIQPTRLLDTLKKVGLKPYHYIYPVFQQLYKERMPIVTLAPKDGPYNAAKAFRLLMPIHYVILNKLIKEYLLTQRYDKVSLLMSALSYIPRQFPELFFKLGSFLLGTSINVQPSIPTFNKLIKILLHHDQKPEFYLHLALKHLKSDHQDNNGVEEVYHSLTSTVISKPPFADHVYFNVFYGNLEYLMWRRGLMMQQRLMNQSSVNQWCDDEDEDENNEDIESKESLNSLHGRRAITYLKPCVERMGTADSSLLHYAELIYHYEGKEAYLDVLRTYVKNNRANHNALKFLFCALHDNTDTEEEIYNVLKDLSDIDPTCAYMKDLIKYYFTQGLYKEALVLLFNRVSHKCCLYSESDWRTLSDVLLMQPMREDVKEFITTLRSRADLTWICSLTTRNSSSNDETLLRYQLNVAEVLGLFSHEPGDEKSKGDIISLGYVTDNSDEYEQVSSPELLPFDDVMFENDFFGKNEVKEQVTSPEHIYPNGVIFDNVFSRYNGVSEHVISTELLPCEDVLKTDNSGNDDINYKNNSETPNKGINQHSFIVNRTLGVSSNIIKQSSAKLNTDSKIKKEKISPDIVNRKLCTISYVKESDRYGSPSLTPPKIKQIDDEVKKKEKKSPNRLKRKHCKISSKKESHRQGTHLKIKKIEDSDFSDENVSISDKMRRKINRRKKFLSR